MCTFAWKYWTWNIFSWKKKKYILFLKKYFILENYFSWRWRGLQVRQSIQPKHAKSSLCDIVNLETRRESFVRMFNCRNTILTSLDYICKFIINRTFNTNWLSNYLNSILTLTNVILKYSASSENIFCISGESILEFI